MLPTALVTQAETVLNAARAADVRLTAAESCTGGLIMACLTEVAGCSDVVERGFVTYTNISKHEMLGVPSDVITQHGAVSEPVARAMAEGAVAKSRAQASVAVTGVAGPSGGTPDKPVGLVHIAAAREGKDTLHRECRFGNVGRSEVRRLTVEAALDLLRTQLKIG
ncbi:MAG: CinA family protein [Rhodospirillales bacterium]|nr:CinA family protein [Rhodospirillales bacterium]